jgi:hypothetical protein
VNRDHRPPPAGWGSGHEIDRDPLPVVVLVCLLVMGGGLLVLLAALVAS